MSDAPFPTEDLLAFIAEAMDFGWPDNTLARSDGEFPDFWNTHFERGSWRYVDLWSGSSTDAGAQFVFYANHPAWCCTYRGGLRHAEDMRDLSVEGNPVFACLVTALRHGRDFGLPIRGPAAFSQGDLEYRFRYAGDINSFLAFESILRDNECVYERVLVGGLFGDGVAYGAPLGGMQP